MDIQRIIERFDKLMREDAFEDAEKHLLYWLKEAEETNDKRSSFTILNEMTGFYRMRGNRSAAFDTVDKLLNLVQEMGNSNTVSRATAYLNSATVFNNFKEPEKAVELYKKAEELYKTELNEEDVRLAGLYNNMALAYLAVGSLETYGNMQDELCDKAEKYFNAALSVLMKNENSYNEQAITYLNMADLEEKQLGFERGEAKILGFLDKAVSCFEESAKGDFYDFKETAEKCIPVFRHYGYFMVANELSDKIKEMK